MNTDVDPSSAPDSTPSGNRRERRSTDDADRQRLAAASVLVVDDEPGMQRILGRLLAERCALVETASTAEAGEALRLRLHFDVLIVDIRLPGLSGLDWVRHLRQAGVRTRVVFMTAYADLSMAVDALRHGADDFVSKPFRAEEMLRALHRALDRPLVAGGERLRRLSLEHARDEFELVAHSASMQRLVERLERVAASPSPALVTGETGVGKGLVARVLHRLGQRRGAFVELDCATLGDADLDVTLFGQIASPTRERRRGFVSRAEGGTLFLDEVAELPYESQARFLGLLDQGAIRPVGADDSRPVNVRIVAATHRDLAGCVTAGRFRADLYHRLAALPLEVPPLREREADIEPLAERFMRELADAGRRDEVAFLHEERRRLRTWSWPGNARELRQAVEQTLLHGRLPSDACGGGDASSNTRVGYPVDWPLERVERAHILAVLEAQGQNKSAAARRLGVSRKTLERKQVLWREDG